MHEDNEVWKDIKGCDGLYQISNNGRVRTWYDSSNSLSNNKRDTPVLKNIFITTYGYKAVTAIYKGNVETLYIHREIAKAFIPNPHNKPLVLHKDDDKLNNALSNLYWGTHQDNMNDRIKNYGDLKGENACNNKLLEEEVKEIFVMLDEGHSQYKIADIFDIDQSTVSDIKRGKSWSHLGKNIEVA